MNTSVTTGRRYITRVSGICGGQPIIKGARTPVKTIIGYNTQHRLLRRIRGG